MRYNVVTMAKNTVFVIIFNGLNWIISLWVYMILDGENFEFSDFPSPKSRDAKVRSITIQKCFKKNTGVYESKDGNV